MKKKENKEAVAVVVKPCPFCGNPAVVREATEKERPDWTGLLTSWVVECENNYCLMHPKIVCLDKRMAVEEWNRRKKVNPCTYDKLENIVSFKEKNNEISIN